MFSVESEIEQICRAGESKKGGSAVSVSSVERSAGVSDIKSKAEINPPTEADLSETIEIQFTPEIIEKVEELEGKTVKIYEFVRNHFKYEPYYGSLKGGPQAFLEMSGNDFDLASCLLSMLRAAGTPSRYVYGTVEIDIEKVMNWTGGVSDPETAVEILATAGIPGQVKREGSVIKKVQMEHVWVEAYVPYGNYRGAGRDGSLKKWVPLDPSFKQYEYKKGMDLYEGMVINGEQFIYDYIEDDSLLPVPDDNTEPDTEYIISPHQYYSARMTDFIDAVAPDSSIEEIIGSDTIGESMEINSKEYPYLLGSLPYKVLVRGANYSSLPDTYRHGIHISVINNTTYETDLSYSTTLPETAGKRFTISYIPATTLDEELADQYNGIFNVPPYLINVAPVIMINGEIAVQGNPVGLGYDQTLNLTFHLPNKASDSVINTITAGSYNALAIQYYKTSPSVIGDKMETLVNTKEITHIDELLGQILYNLGVSYFHHITHQEYLYEKNLQMVVTREPSEAIVTLHAKTEWLWGVPHRVSEGGVGIDVDRNIYAPFSMDGDKERAKDFMIISVLGSSAWEDMSLEAFFDIPAVSASKILKMARMEGIVIHTIESSNIDTILPQLEIDSADKNDIRNAVYAGKTVIVPEKKIQYNDWRGAGYVVLDTETGGGGYMISGGLSGGELSRKPGGTLQFCRTSAPSLFKAGGMTMPDKSSSSCFDYDPSIFITALTRAAIVKVAKSLIGVTYTWGGEDPTCGFDCSGFVDYLFYTIYGRTVFPYRMPTKLQYSHLNLA